MIRLRRLHYCRRRLLARLVCATICLPDRLVLRSHQLVDDPMYPLYICMSVQLMSAILWHRVHIELRTDKDNF